jgi:diaminohydroxyphosphoribosylaminopyrimidine deaminase / 5-amino-6-(5-phosphoribosylamino)uracil reductase
VNIDHTYLYRCIELARRGAGSVAPNPLVGAVLVHDGMIIGEGWHQQYGQAHAEVNCINQAIQQGHAEKIPLSTMYVSLEPCAHFGKTPPCADLIIQHSIPAVVIGCRDPFEAVNGKGIEKLRAAGVNVQLADEEVEKACKELNKRFFTFHTKQRPYIRLKWAQSANKKIAGIGERVLISNEYTNRLVHKWRSEEAGILVGTNTALLDNPSLTNRLYEGSTPVRLILDMDLRLPASLHVFDRMVRTIVFNSKKQQEQEGQLYYKISKENDLVAELLQALYLLNIQSVLVEGGSRLLQSFIDSHCWDEIAVITNTKMSIDEGLNAPVFSSAIQQQQQTMLTDTIETYIPTTN